MFGQLGNLANLMKSAKEIQANMTKLQSELADKRFEADSGGGAVRATVDGKGTLIDIRIEPSAANDVELLEDLVKAAVCAATTKSQESMKTEMANVTGGLDLSNFSQMLGGGQTPQP